MNLPLRSLFLMLAFCIFSTNVFAAQRNVPFQLIHSTKQSPWSRSESGLLVAQDKTGYEQIVKKLGPGDTANLKDYAEDRIYFFIFAGQTLSGRGHEISVKEIWRENSVESGRRGRPGGRNNLYVHVAVTQYEGQILIVRSPLTVISVKRADIQSAISEETEMRMFTELIRSIDTEALDFSPALFE